MGFDPDDDQEKLERYVRDYDPAYDMVPALEPEERDQVEGLVLAKFKDSAPLPTTIITDRDGHVLLTTGGVPTLSEVRRLMDQQQ